MAELRVHAEQVVAAANRIKKLNDRMRDGFDSVQNAVTKLDNSWDSAAASSAMERFNSIKKDYCDARYHAVDDFVAFLHRQVGEGYTQTETANQSLADQFR